MSVANNSPNHSFLVSLAVRRMDSPRKQKFLLWWQSLRAKGIARYVFTSGVFGFGLPCAVLYVVGYTAYEAQIHKTPFMDGLANLFSAESLGKLLIMIGAFALAGLFWGWRMWRHYNRVYEALKQE